MALINLRIHNLRNISFLDLHPDPGINLIHGKNGSGKTTLLESVFLLARAKSFRSSRTGPLIRKGDNELVIYGEYQTQQLRHTIGIRKRGNETALRLDGNKVKRTSDIAQILPIQIITPHSHQLLERGPEFRRRFIEWGVFHVEHQYHAQFRRYQRALHQRNAALKGSRENIAVWNEELANSGEYLDSLRKGYVKLLTSYLSLENNLLFPDHKISIDWRPGWDNAVRLIEALERSYPGDREKGYTQVGPHRADLLIKMDDQRASNIASRGQQKLIITALKMAQLSCYIEKKNETPILLLDDLGAELDQENLQTVIKRLKDISVQTFITATDKHNFKQNYLDKVFHVEHGEMVTV